MVDHFSAYIYQKRGFYYFSRRVPKQLQHCHSKQRIVLALNTRSRAKALKHAQVICQRLDERCLPMRPDAMGLNNVFANDFLRLKICFSNVSLIPSKKKMIGNKKEDIPNQL